PGHVPAQTPWSDEEPPSRTPGLYGESATPAAPGPQPLYGGAPPMPENGAAQYGESRWPDSEPPAQPMPDAGPGGTPRVPGRPPLPPSAYASGPPAGHDDAADVARMTGAGEPMSNGARERPAGSVYGTPRLYGEPRP